MKGKLKMILSKISQRTLKTKKYLRKSKKKGKTIPLN